MKVVIAAEIFPPDIGGPATYCVQMAHMLFDAGWDVSVICYSDSPQLDSYPFRVVRVVRGSNALLRYAQYFFALVKIAKHADVIYAQGPVSSGLPTRWVAKVLRKKYVVKVVGDYAWEQARNASMTTIGIDEFQTKNFRGKIGKLKKIEALNCRQATKVITPSMYLQRIVTGWGIPEKNIEVIYNTFEALPQGKEIDVHGDIILSVGRLVPWKGFETLIRLMPELLKENPNFHLIILGSGPLEGHLKSVIAQLGIENNVTLTSVRRDQLRGYFSQANMFVLNTGYEGLSHVILEMMSVDVPVITTKVCGNPELVIDGVSGTLVEYDNAEQLKQAIVKLWKQPELGKQFAHEAKKHLERFGAEDMKRKTIEVLQNV